MVSGKERMHGGPRLLLLFRYRVGVWVFKDAAAAAAKSHQSCLTLCDPQRRLPHPWDFPGKNTTVGCQCLLHSRMHYW